MAGGDQAGSSPVLGGLAQLGKFFQMVAVIPATAIVIPTYALVAAGAPRSAPSRRRLLDAISNLSLESALGLVLAIVIVGQLTHPFQFIATQALEGYWGPSRFGRSLARSRARLHARRRRSLSRAARNSGPILQTLLEDARHTQEWPTQRAVVSARVDHEGLLTGLSRYPLDPDSTMPTRLGNILRRYEESAGLPYGLFAPTVAPHLMFLVDDRVSDYVNDTRSDLDLAVRFVVSWLILGAVSFVLLWPFGRWLVVPLAAYGLAWTSYLGAVRAADEYGASLHLLTDFGQPALDRQFAHLLGRPSAIQARSTVISSVLAREPQPQEPPTSDIWIG